MIIVTGAAGLIGSSIVWGLNQAGINDIILVDNLRSSEKWKNLRALKYADYLEKDVFREMLLSGNLPQNVTAIIHMGACSATTETDASYLIDNNFEVTKELALYCVKKGIKFIYASSSATYGDGANGYVDDEDNLDYLRPMNMYGYSKHMFDLWAKRKGLFSEITGLKFTNVYGPNERHKAHMRSVVCRAYEQISEGGKLQLFKSYRSEYKDGEQMRDFLYVKDAVKMVLFLLNHQNSGGLFNIGSGIAETWNALADAAFKAFDKPINIEYIEMPEHLKDKYQYYTKAEMGKLLSLGYDGGTMGLKDSIHDYICNYMIVDKFLGDE
ncbi:ADP-glyceromanno-heptose 6-epimerase [Lentisphaerota bacterium WC36G]|nr:ADP-glyceromanno-heptose 6-epimerase [Lentisphaerae bacterium WC36]